MLFSMFALAVLRIESQLSYLTDSTLSRRAAGILRATDPCPFRLCTELIANPTHPGPRSGMPRGMYIPSTLPFTDGCR
ncbi:hypothetical protein B0H19DRAFT_1146358 [Mycena capillaripes]|nr:hypothetical protein B0H19DRAFT_1146358 [Mycena capillaripes]